MPAEYPLPVSNNDVTVIPKPQSVLYNLLRPNFVSKYSTPLSPNSLMQWIKNDPNKETLDTHTKKATELLFSQTLPTFASYLVIFSYYS